MADAWTTAGVIGLAVAHYVWEGRLKAKPDPAVDVLHDLTMARVWNLVSLSCLAAPIVELFVRPTVSPGWAMLGLPVMGIGIGLRYASMMALGRFFTYPICMRADHELVTTGVYARLRHPSYLANLILLSGAAFALQSRFLPVALILFLVMTIMRIQREDELLDERFGETWRAYAQRAKALVPGLF